MLNSEVDVVLIGAGVISATAAALIKRLQPDWSVVVCERLPEVALESSDGWNNAGTGHAALCELNYTPEASDGSIEIAKALGVHEDYLVTQQLWSSLVQEGALGAPASFVNPTPHMSLTMDERGRNYLSRRHAALRQHHFFEGMQFSSSREQVGRWAPLLAEGRSS